MVWVKNRLDAVVKREKVQAIFQSSVEEFSPNSIQSRLIILSMPLSHLDVSGRVIRSADKMSVKCVSRGLSARRPNHQADWTNELTFHWAMRCTSYVFFVSLFIQLAEFLSLLCFCIVSFASAFFQVSIIFHPRFDDDTKLSRGWFIKMLTTNFKPSLDSKVSE